jgi:L-malate glycosyltransferase
MKILHIIDSMGLGGAQIVVKGIFESQKNNDNIFLFSLREKSVKIGIDHPNFIIFKSNQKYSFKPFKELKELIKKEKIDVLHCHLFRSQVFGYLLKRLYFKEINLVFHEHGRIFTNNFIYNIFLKLVKSKVDLFLAVSGATKDNLIMYGKIKEKKIKVLYNFVDLEKFNRENIVWNIKEERKKLGISEDDFVLGFAGRLVERKGWREFLEASKILIKENKKIKFLIAGNGRDREALIKFIKLNRLEKNVIFLGYVSDMTWFYSLLDCFVIPSHWEPMGLTEIESQALMVPVISANVPALNEIIIDSENGLLFEVRNVDDFVEKIKIVHEDKELRAKLVKNGLENVIKYSLLEYLKKLNKIYEY